MIYENTGTCRNNAVPMTGEICDRPSRTINDNVTEIDAILRETHSRLDELIAFLWASDTPSNSDEINIRDFDSAIVSNLDFARRINEKTRMICDRIGLK